MRSFAWMADRSFRLFEKMQANISGARDYWAAVNFNAPVVIGLLGRLGVSYPRVMDGAASPGPLVLPLRNRPLCKQPRRDGLRAVPH